jgi:glycosyltransferase involved in cell wall biosynthesis
MFGCAAYVLPSKPRPEFIETFGIALAEKMLVGGRGPIITTTTGGIPEAVGDCALTIAAGSPQSIRQQLEKAVFSMSELEKQSLSARARSYALQFDRHNVFDLLMERLPEPASVSVVQAAAG